MMKLKGKRIQIINVVLMLILVLSIQTAYAADADTLDMTAKGSITVYLRDSETGETITGGSFTAYHIADISKVNADLSYVLTPDFAAGNIRLDNPSADSVREGLDAYVKNNSGLAGTRIQVNDKGAAIFTDLSLGLYFIVQNESTDEYYPISPFVVSVPMTVNDTWVYNVDATPKTELVVKKKTVPETTPATTPAPTPTETVPSREKILGINDISGVLGAALIGCGIAAFICVITIIVLLIKKRKL